MCTKFCSKRTTSNKVTEKTKNTDELKFADPKTAAVSPYFKRSVVSINNNVTNKANMKRCSIESYISDIAKNMRNTKSR